MSNLTFLLGIYWLEVAPILILPWAVATITLLISGASRGWRQLPLWQRWYLMAAGIVLPLFLFFVLLHWYESVVSASQLYRLWLMVLVVLAILIEWVGIAIGLILLVKKSSEIVNKVTKTMRHPSQNTTDS
jgi:hypothetical protein